MLSRSITKALYQPSTTLPPTFLLPLRARLTTITTSTATTDPNPPTTSYTHHPTSQPPTPSTPHSPPQQQQHQPAQTWPPHLSHRSPLPRPITNHPDLTLLPLLAAQPPHYITAHLHSRPYLLTQGDLLRLPFHLPHATPGAILRLTRASLLGSRDYTLRGSPYIDEKLFMCRVVVVGVEGEPLRVVVKTKQRNRKVRRRMHKMRFTVVRVVEVRVRVEGEAEEAEKEEEELEEEEIGRGVL